MDESAIKIDENAIKMEVANGITEM